MDRLLQSLIMDQFCRENAWLLSAVRHCRALGLVVAVVLLAACNEGAKPQSEAAESTVACSGEANSEDGTPIVQVTDDVRKTTQSDKSMTEEDARTAIINMLRNGPPQDLGRMASIQTATIVRVDAGIEIGLYRCNLDKKTFVYGVMPFEGMKNYSATSGVFYQDANGQWTGKVTGRTIAHRK